MIKKSLILLVFCVATGVFAQSIEEFKLGESFFAPMQLIDAKILEEEAGGRIKENPLITTDKVVISMLTRGGEVYVKSLYGEFYLGDKRHKDAGLLVYEFYHQEDIEKVLLEMQIQENYILFTKGNYLLKVWVDDNQEVAQKIFKKTTDYYINQLSMKLAKAKKEVPVIDAVSETDTEPTEELIVEGVREVEEELIVEGAVGVEEAIEDETIQHKKISGIEYSQVGNNSIRTDLITDKELKKLYEKTKAIEKKYNVEISFDSTNDKDELYKVEMVLSEDDAPAKSSVWLYFYEETGEVSIQSDVLKVENKIKKLQPYFQKNYNPQKVYQSLDRFFDRIVTELQK